MSPLSADRSRARDAFAERYRATGLWRGASIGTSFAATVDAAPAATALIDAGVALSFADLAARARRCAGGLAALGVGPGDAVAYQLPNWAEAAAALLATVSLGACAVPIVPILRTREVASILAEIEPKVAFVPQAYRGVDYPTQTREAAREARVPPPQLVVVRGDGDQGHGAQAFAALDAEGPAGPLAAVDAGSLAVIIYTSGSTARPKGAMHTHETLAAELRSLIGAHGLGPADRVLMPSPLTHISGVVHGVLGPALLGTSAVLMDRWEPGAALAAIERHRVTYLIGAPTFLQEMLSHPDVSRRDLSSLRLCSCGGATVPPELLRASREKIPTMVAKRVYGSSEFPTIATTTAADAAARGLDTEGRALEGVEIRIVDEAGRPAPPGVEGEIRARGPECFLGYVDEALDAESFDEGGYFRTGDLGVLDGDGYLRVTGRVKDIIVRKGEKISAREIEDLLAEHPTVAEVAVVPVADPETGERACACVRPAPDRSPPTLDELVAFLRGRELTPQKLPERLALVLDFPRTPSGKINKRLLREQVERTRPA